MSTTLDYARKYANMGFCVIPLAPRLKTPEKRFDLDRYFETKPTESELTAWFDFADNNIGLITGKISEKFVIDIDGKEAERVLSTTLNGIGERIKTDILNTMRAITGNDGLHLVFSYRPEEWPEGLKSKKLWTGEGEHSEIRLKGEGGYIVAAPSIHPDTGRQYQLVNDNIPILLTRKEITEIINAFQVIPKRNALSTLTENRTANNPLTPERMQRLLKIVEPIYTKGSRDDVVFYLSGYFRKVGGHPLDTAERFISLLCERTGDEEKQSRLEVVKNTYKKNIQELKGYTGLVECLALKVGLLETPKLMAEITEIVGNAEQNVKEEYLHATEKCKDPDLLLRLIKDDGIEAFRSGLNNQVYLIVTRFDNNGKEQIQIPSSDFSTYARRVFARDYDRIAPMSSLLERIGVVSDRIKDPREDDDENKLKQDLKVLMIQFSELAKEYRTQYGHRPTIHDQVIGEEAVNNVSKQLTTFATTKRNLHLRSFIDENGWYYDLQNDQYEYILITKDGYTIKNDAYYYFRRPTRQGTNDRPITCKDDEAKKVFDSLFEDLNFLGPDGKEYDNQQKTLFKIYTLWLFYNDHRTMRPIESIKASPNSGKTTAVKIQKLIYDPTASFGSLVKTWGAGKKDDRRDRFVVASGQAFTAFDNVKRATNEEQDDMCVMATGGAHETRKLFTDSDINTLEIQTNVAYTSVNDIATFADLIRRQIQFKLDEGKIAINEDALFDSLLANRPKILHWIFCTLAEAQKKLDSVNANSYTRHRGLWKFVMIGDCIAEAMGESGGFVSKLFDNIPLLQAQRAVENDAFAGACLRWIMNIPELRLELTANELKVKVEEDCAANKDYTATKDYTWPDTAKAVSSRLEYLKPTFKAFKIMLERGKIIHGYRPWIITKQLDDEGKKTNEGSDGKGDAGDMQEIEKKSTALSKNHAIFRMIVSELAKNGPIEHEICRREVMKACNYTSGEAHQEILDAVKDGLLRVVDTNIYELQNNATTHQPRA